MVPGFWFNHVSLLEKDGSTEDLNWCSIIQLFVSNDDYDRNDDHEIMSRNHWKLHNF